ncbi:hypothetical protein LIER_23953 [Lithospermum erythrorhizon]|uniref:Uncharacterized protein n=1 Tax=Lithospermum erythrorhizon TaxID=34254 RepID=A0AAV3QZD7_LITER
MGRRHQHGVAKRAVLTVGTTKAFSLPSSRTGSLDSSIPILLRPLQVSDQQGKLPREIPGSGGLKTQVSGQQGKLPREVMRNDVPEDEGRSSNRFTNHN